MFRCRRGSVIVAFWLTVVCLSGQAQEGEKQPQGATSEQEATSDRPPSPLPIVIVESEEAAVARQSAEDEAAHRDKLDLAAQNGMNLATQRMAKYALWQTVMIFVGTVALICTLYLTRRATEAAAQSVSVAQTIGQHQLRAYLSATLTHVKFSWPDPPNFPGPINVTFHVSVKNHGQTPAQNVRVWANIGFSLWPLPESDISKLKEELSQRAVAAPGEIKNFTFEETFTFDPSHLFANPPYTTHIVGIVRYDTIDGPQYTRFFHGIKNMSAWYLKQRIGETIQVETSAAEHSNDAT